MDVEERAGDGEAMGEGGAAEAAAGDTEEAAAEKGDQE